MRLRWFARFRQSLKVVLRTVRDRLTRFRLRPSSERGAILCATTWEFPNPTHGYAYQEILGFTALGLEVRILFGDRRDAAGLANRFSPLLRRLVRIETLVNLHERDLAQLDRHRPGRVDSFLHRVSAATGKSVAVLRRDPLVLRACTFTRICEVAKVRYVQTWFFYDMSFMAMFAAAVLGIPRGISCHVDHVLDDHPLKLVPLQVETADLVLAISRRTERELLDRAGEGHRGKFLVKRVGVDASALRPTRARRASGGLFELVSISRIEPKKGLTALVDACRILQQQGIAFHLRIVGGTDSGNPTSAGELARLRARIEAAGLGDCVTLVGPIGSDGVPAELARADAFVAPYVELETGDKDGIPTSLLEAMAAGLPIVCTDAGAMLEAVADDREALVVPQHEAVALAAALARLAGDRDLRARIGRAAAERFDAEFDARVTDLVLHQRIRALLASDVDRDR